MDNKRNAELVDIAKRLVGILSEEERKEVFASSLRDDGLVPISVFRSSLSGLEALVVYLKDVRGLSTKETAKLLSRNHSTIYTTYNNAVKKGSKGLDCSDFSIAVPVDAFADRKFSILESLVAYLKRDKGIALVKIAALLGKSYSTVKTTYRRYAEKCN